MSTTLLTATQPVIGNLWRNGRRKKDGYQAYQVVRFLLERTCTNGYRLTPQPPCAGETLTYPDMTSLKLYWDWWANDQAKVDYTRLYP